MKIVLLRLLPVSLLLLGLNSCVVAPGPGGPYASARVSSGGGYSDDGDGGGYDDEGQPLETGYWSPSGVYSAVYLPGYERSYVYYDGYGHRSRYGHYNRHGHEIHHRGSSSHSHGSSHTQSQSHTRSQTHSYNNNTHTQGTTHHTPPKYGAPSFKAAQHAAPAALQKKGAPVKKKNDDHH